MILKVDKDKLKASDPYEKKNLLTNPSPTINEVRNSLFQEALRIRE